MPGAGLFCRRGGTLMKRLPLLVAILFVLPLLGSDAPKDYQDGIVYADGLDGSWLLVRYEADGEARKIAAGLVLTYRRGEVESWPPDGGPNRVLGTYRADPGARPATLDTFYTDGFHQGKIWRSIYRIDGDTLYVGYQSGGARRPEGFDDKADLHVETYRRLRR